MGIWSDWSQQRTSHTGGGGDGGEGGTGSSNNAPRTGESLKAETGPGLLLKVGNEWLSADGLNDERF